MAGGKIQPYFWFKKMTSGVVTLWGLALVLLALGRLSADYFSKPLGDLLGWIGGLLFVCAGLLSLLLFAFSPQ